jgi:hypothetical protein
MKDVMSLDQIHITFEDVERIKGLAQKSNKVSLINLPFHEGTLYVDCGKGRDSFAIYFNILTLDFAMYIPSLSSTIPSMQFKMDFDKGDFVFCGDTKKHWKKNKKGQQMLGTYYLWCIATFVYLLDSSLSNKKANIKVIQKV